MRDELDKRKGDGDGDVQMEVEDRPGEQADIEQMAVVRHPPLVIIPLSTRYISQDPASVSKDISRTRKIPELYPPPTPQVSAVDRVINIRANCYSQVDARANNAHNRLRTGEPIDVVRVRVHLSILLSTS